MDDNQQKKIVDFNDGEAVKLSKLLANLIAEWEKLADRYDRDAQKGYNCCEITEFSARSTELRICANTLKTLLLNS